MIKSILKIISKEWNWPEGNLSIALDTEEYNTSIKIALLNKISFLGIFVFTFYSILNFISRESVLASSICLASILIFTCILFLVRKKHIRYASLLILSYCNAVIFISSCHFGEKNNVHYFYFPLSIASLLFFSLKSKFRLSFSLFIPLICLAFLFYIDFKLPFIPYGFQENYKLLPYMNFLISFSLIFLIVYLVAVAYLKLYNRVLETHSFYRANIEVQSRIVCILNKSFRIIDYNQKFVEYIHYTMDKKPEKFDNFLKYIQEERIETVQSLFNRTLEGEEISYEKKVFVTDGSEKWLLVRYVPMTNHEKSITGIIVTIKDISEQKEKEEQIRLLSSVTINANDAIIITEAEPLKNPGPRILYVNEAFTKMTGYTREDVYGKTPRILQGAKTSRETLNKVSEALSKWESVNVELINYKKNGEEFWVELSIYPIADETGFFTHWVSIQREITERKKFEEELKAVRENAEKANKAKSMFLANMSHEIRTPMNAIIGLTEELMLNEKDPVRKKTLSYIYSSGDILMNLINDILDLSKIEAGKVSINMETFSIREFMEDCISLFKNRANARNNTIIIDSIPETIPDNIISDSKRLRQVLINLIGNAIKFTKDGLVQLKLENLGIKDNKIKLNFIISDTGIGIPPEKQKIIFDNFIQADESITRIFGGTGLGLAISKNLVEMMGGHISVNSPGLQIINGIKKSSTDFTITLECGISEVHSINKSISESQDFAIKRELKFLLVEDNPINQFLIQTLFEKVPSQITIVENGFEALEKCATEKFDMILMDLQMPVMDGYETSVKIREKGVKTPIIAVSANAYQDSINACIEAGMNDYLTKPFKQKNLFNMIEKYIKE